MTSFGGMCVLSILAVFLSYEDLRTRSVLLSYLMFYGILTVFWKTPDFLSLGIGLSLLGILLVYQHLRPYLVMGEADLFLIFTAPFYLSLASIPFFLISCGVFLGILWLFLRETKLPFVPVFFLSLFISMLQEKEGIFFKPSSGIVWGEESGPGSYFLEEAH